MTTLKTREKRRQVAARQRAAMRLCRVSFAGSIVVLMAFSLSAASAHAQMGAAAPTYADQPLDYWQDLLAQHVGKESDADKEQCRRAAQALGRFGPGAKQAVPLLVQALQSPSTEVREFAVDALGRIGLEPQTVVPAIVAEADLPPEHINYKPLAPFRRLAARALGRFGPEAAAAVPLLEKALQNEDPLYRVQAALALWRISQHPQAIPALRAALKRNESETAFEAVLAVAEIGAGARAAASDLVEALNHPDPDVRRAAASALVPLGADQLEAVAQRLSDGGFQSPAAAAYVLGQLLDELRPRVFYHPLMDAQQLAAATRPVIRLAAPALVRLLAHPDAEVRQTARGSLAQMGLLAAPFLLQSLQSDKESVQSCGDRGPDTAGELSARRVAGEPWHGNDQGQAGSAVDRVDEALGPAGPPGGVSGVRQVFVGRGGPGSRAAVAQRLARPGSGHSPIRVRGPAATGGEGGKSKSRKGRRVKESRSRRHVPRR
jgi:HEAT repeat protein